jgi:hypothetical protein
MPVPKKRSSSLGRTLLMSTCPPLTMSLMKIESLCIQALVVVSRRSSCGK